jgi:hypothetical protein
MQPAHGPLSEEPRGDVPLPPVLTHHTPAAGPADAETLVAPFVAGAARPTPPPQRPVPEPAVEPTAPPSAAASAPEPEPMPWEVQAAAAAEPEEPWAVAPEPTFPLDAFILPPDALVARPLDTQRELAVAAAERLEALAARLRAEGFAALLAPGADARPIDLLLASLLAGYVAR